MTRTFDSETGGTLRDCSESMLDLYELSTRRENGQGVTGTTSVPYAQRDLGKYLYAPPSALAMLDLYKNPLNARPHVYCVCLVCVCIALS